MKENQHIGHRSRIKEKLLRSKQGDLFDYEILELILCYANPRKDMKKLSKELIAHYGGLSSTLHADYKSLKEFSGIGDSAITLFKLFQESIVRSTQAEINNKPIVSSSKALIDYLRSSMSFSSVEMFRILYLNKSNILIKDMLFDKGTIDQVSVYPREILKQAIFYQSSAIILVHNHPSGNSKPSPQDIRMTNNIKDALKIVNILIHDHIIICKNEYYSFKAQGLL